jgi:hypothetical protein
MEKERVKQLMTQADAALEMASEERMRPEEDVVPFSICHNSRVSIRMYLMSYLLKHGVQPNTDESTKDLLTKCSAFDKRFAHLDISEVECGGSRPHNDDYCLSVNKVTNCFEAANQVRKLIHDIL